MNPFTESTVARALARPPRRLKLVVAKSPCQRKRQPRVDARRCTADPLTSPGLATAGAPAAGTPAAGTPAAGTPAAGTQPAGMPADHSPTSALAVAGTFATAAGLLATFFLPGLAFALDINAATQEQLRGVRGIGPKTAQIIIEERSRGGRYESLEDLSDRVKGIGSKKAASLQAAGLSVGTGGASPIKPAGGPASIAAKPVTPGQSASKPSGPSGGRSVFRLPSPAK